MRLVNEIHAELLAGVRGGQTAPGELRTLQVWIGSEGATIQEARFVPPPPGHLPGLLTDWENFLNEDLEVPPLIQSAMMHYQFEAIHPYFDGNGRIGRLLITLFLCAKDILSTPLLYLSAYIDRHRNEYYDRLYDVSATGDWEPWLWFYLQGVVEQAKDALLRSRRVRALHDKYRMMLEALGATSGNALRLLDELFAHPFMTVPFARQRLGISQQGARNILERLTQAGILFLDVSKWPHVYVAGELLEAIEAPVAGPVEGG
jgi:Fic family protein